uniref:Uncharacterized protein n=1 Tax=Oncorhynchus tshawytscha TaxID=74940 RepID=A0A8C8D5L6_ONCTS
LYTVISLSAGSTSPSQALINPGGLGTAENQVTVEALYDLSVDIQKIHQLKGWVLQQSPAYVSEMASMLRDIEAEGLVNAWVLELYPEAVLCSPEQQHKFLASFFTCSSHHANQRANIDYFQFAPEQAHHHKADGQHPQSFRCPVGQSEEIIHLELWGDATNMKIWLQKLLSQNPFVLLKPSEVLSDNLLFLETRDFTTAELLLLHLLSKLRVFVTKLNRDSMRLNLAYSKETGLFRSQLSSLSWPTVLELTTQI